MGWSSSGTFSSASNSPLSPLQDPDPTNPAAAATTSTAAAAAEEGSQIKTQVRLVRQLF